MRFLLIIYLTVSLAWSMPLQMKEGDIRVPEDQSDLGHSPGQRTRRIRSANKKNCRENPVSCLPVKVQDLIDQNDSDRDGRTFNISNGAGVHIFLLDTGVMDTHQEFTTDRARLYLDVLNKNGNKVTGDLAGHGTRAASIAMGQNIGIARGATLESIRVSQVDEHSGIIKAENNNVKKALDNVTSWANANLDKKCVVLYSLAGQIDNDLNEKFQSVTDNTDCVVVVPSGNVDDSQDYNACKYSVGSMSDVITVGATGKNDTLYERSTYGECVDIYAPGEGINAANHMANTSYTKVSGTSYAAAAVAGAAAVILSNYPIPHRENKTMTQAVKDILIATSVDRIKGLTPEKLSFNRLLNVQNTTVYGSIYE